MFINFGCAAVIRPLHTLRSARRDQARAHGHGAESSQCERLRPVLCSAPPCVTRRLPAGGPLPFAGRRPPMPGFGVRPWALAHLRRLLAACASARGRDRGPRWPGRGRGSVAFPARVRRPPRHVARSERRLRPSASPALPFRRGSETSSPIRSESFGPWGKPGPGGRYRTEKLTTVSSGPELSSSESPRPVKRQAGGVFRSRRASRRAPVVASPPPPGSHGEPDSWWPLTPRLPSKRASS